MGIVRVEALPAWLVLGAALTGAVVTAVLHVPRTWRARSRAVAPGRPSVTARAENPSVDVPPVGGTDAAGQESDDEFSSAVPLRAQVGWGARKMVRDRKPDLERAQSGNEAEVEVVTELFV